MHLSGVFGVVWGPIVQELSKMSLPSTGQGLSKLKKKHFRVKHQKVKLFRANEPFLSVLMWGINHTVSKFQKKL